MRPRFNTARIQFIRRRILVGLCVIAHLAVTTGFPVPRRGETKVESAPFPCQHHQCGCRSADHCWKSCCCMSMREKLAWASANGVKPPDYVIAAAAEEIAAVGSKCCNRRSDPGISICCSKHEAQACCSHDRSLNRGNRHDNCKGQNDRDEWVIGIHALKCRGQGQAWVTTGAVAPPPALIEMPVDPAPPVYSVVAFLVVHQPVGQPPDVPPPRSS